MTVKGERNPEWVNTRRAARMDAVDSLPPEMRALVHEYGLSVVTALMDCGVKKPKRMRHVVETILNELSPTRGAYSSQGPRIQNPS